MNISKSSGSTIVQIFSRQQLFGAVTAKKLQFSDFLEGKRFIFESCLHKKFRNVNGLARIDWTPLGGWAAAIKFLVHFFGPVFVKQRAEIFETFRIRFDIPHCPLSFVTSTLIFRDRNCRIPLLIATMYWKCSNRPERNFCRRKILRRRVLGECDWKTRFFRGQVLCCRTCEAHFPRYGIPMLVRLRIMKRSLHLF